MRITTKGQVTIPKEIRDHLTIVPHDEVDFIVKEAQVILIKSNCPVNRFQEHLKKKMKGTGTIKMSTDEIMLLTRGE